MDRLSLLRPFIWTKYEVVLAVEAPLLLPAYKGATLRGSFGNTLKRLCCSHNPATCEARLPECACPYGSIFSPQTPESNPHLRAGEEIARPFVIQPPLDYKREYQPGERVSFNLLLFGRADMWLPYFLVTFRDLPPIGIPPHRGRVSLHEVWATNDLLGIQQRIYTASEQLVRNANLAMSWEALAATSSQYPTNSLTLHFHTNTILRYLGNKNGVRKIEFHILISRLLQRIETLMGLYVNSSVLDDTWRNTARELIRAARAVTIHRDDTQWHSWKRYSTRQQQEIPMDGVIGKITYTGDLSPFLPLLLLGQYTHVGKGCVFGLGQYTVLHEGG